jgi:hypothetical protein
LIGSKITKKYHGGVKFLGVLSPSALGKMSTWFQPLGKKRLFNGGVGPMFKVLEAYMGEAMLLTNLATMLWVVIVLF